MRRKYISIGESWGQCISLLVSTREVRDDNLTLLPRGKLLIADPDFYNFHRLGMWFKAVVKNKLSFRGKK